MKLNIYSEECCEHCQEIIHNHFDCPECGTHYASTDVYESLYELPKHDVIISCEMCGTQYKLLDGEPYDSNANWFKLKTA
jgi:hypothetical protein